MPRAKHGTASPCPRHLRVLTGALGKITQRTMRDKFARLAQMATLLSVEVRRESKMRDRTSWY